jgi:hypothetical protein
MSGFEEDLEKALKIFRDARKRAVEENIDGRAFRVALKVVMMIDDLVAIEHISEEEDMELTRIACRLFREMLKKEEVD